jgi:hypothetical protein
MKDEVLTKLDDFQGRARDLRRAIKAERSAQIAKSAHRTAADALATFWVEELRSPLEHKFKLPAEAIAKYSELARRLHVLSRPNNSRNSYMRTLDELVEGIANDLILPLKQIPSRVETKLDLGKLLPTGGSDAEKDYLKEALDCAQAGYFRASVVMGWSAAVSRMQRRIQMLGYPLFNQMSSQLKAQTSGKFKRWNKEFNVQTFTELQEVFDTDLITVLEGMGLLDGNQADRLRSNFQYRNHSAHPGEAPVVEAHLVAFYTDIGQIIFSNPKFKLS